MKKMVVALMVLSVVSAQAYDLARVESVQKQYPQYKRQIQTIIGESVNYVRQATALQIKYAGKVMPEYEKQYLRGLQEAAADKERELAELLDKIELNVDWMMITPINEQRLQEAQRKYPQQKARIQQLVGQINTYSKWLVSEQSKSAGKTVSASDIAHVNTIQKQLQATEKELNDLLDRLH